MANYFENLRIFTAKNFKDSLIEGGDQSANLFLTFGRSLSWANDSAPPSVTSNTKTEVQVWNDMIGAKRILSTDVKHAIRRYDWVANTVYTQYDDQDANLFSDNTQFYVLTSDYNVYKCLNNKNGRPSNVMPTSVATSGAVTLSDGYTWKYMYTINAEERIKFLVGDYMPVKTLQLDDSSLQWDVQENAEEGPIHSIIVTNGGSNYTNVANIIVYITGDGEGAAASATINTASNTVNSVVMTTIGNNYTRASVVISGGGGTGATARAVITPFGGHGKDPVFELGGKNIFINTRLIGNENKYPSTTEFRQIAVIKDPKVYGTDQISSNNIVSQTTDLSLYNFAVSVGVSLDYDIDETVYQGTSVEEYTFKGKVVSWDGANNYIRLNNVEGTPTLYETLYGATTATAKLINEIKNPDLKAFSGQTLYVDNFTRIIKDPYQTEDLKVLIKF